MKIKDFIVCDDVRIEVGNKATLVGIYDVGVSIAQENPKQQLLPLHLGIYTRLQLEQEDPEFDAYEIEFVTNEKVYFKVSGSVAISNRVFPVVLVGSIPHFPVIGTMLFTFNIKCFSQGKQVNSKAPDYAFIISVIPDNKTPVRQ